MLKKAKTRLFGNKKIDNQTIQRAYLFCALGVAALFAATLTAATLWPSTSVAHDPSVEVIHIDHAQFNELLDGDEPVSIIDVRSENEFAAGRVPNSINLPHKDILNNISLLDAFRDKNVIVYCRSGRRAGKVTDFLIDQGFSQQGKLYHLEGDMQGWEKAGLGVCLI